MESPGEEALLTGLAAGDELALAALYDRFGSSMYRAALTMLRNREDAEDVVQDVFVSLVRSRTRLAAVEDLRAYLFTSLRRAAGRVAVRRQRQPTASEEVEQATAANQPRLHGQHDECLERAIGELPQLQREVIGLKIEGELTFAQIGQVLGVSQNTAASRYRYALEKLRAALGEKAQS